MNPLRRPIIDFLIYLAINIALHQLYKHMATFIINIIKAYIELNLTLFGLKD